MLKKFNLESTGSPNFIQGWFLEDITVCDRLINYFDSSPEKLTGKVYSENSSKKSVDNNIKKSLEVYFENYSTEPVFLEYIYSLQSIVQEYVKMFPWCDEFARWSLKSSVNIQFYPTGGGFKTWHCERGAAVDPVGSRHLVFMTYLNTVEQDGGTEFFHQKIISPARKGLTLIWPADWTHLHRGVISPHEEKYIITGWFNFME